MGCHLHIHPPNLGNKTCHGDSWAAGHSMRVLGTWRENVARSKGKEEQIPESRTPSSHIAEWGGGGGVLVRGEEVRGPANDET